MNLKSFPKLVLDAIKKMRDEPEIKRFFAWRLDNIFQRRWELCLYTRLENGILRGKVVWNSWSGHSAAEMSVCLANVGHAPINADELTYPVGLIGESNMWVLPGDFDDEPAPAKTLMETLV